jgi:hypothetical protein
VNQFRSNPTQPTLSLSNSPRHFYRLPLSVINVISGVRLSLPVWPDKPTFCCGTISVAVDNRDYFALQKNSDPLAVGLPASRKSVVDWAVTHIGWQSAFGDAAVAWPLASVREQSYTAVRASHPLPANPLLSN